MKFVGHWIVALFGCVVWSGGLMALMIAWAVQGFPLYHLKSNTGRSILYISDIAATNLQPLFIVTCSVQALCFVGSLAFERYLRHSGRLHPNWRRREKVFATAAIVFAVIGQFGIVFVAIFNTNAFPHVHVSMLVVFLVGMALSALCTISEFALLDKNYRHMLRLRLSYLFKCIWFVIAISLAIAFGVLSTRRRRNAAAVCEWVLGFSYSFYYLSLVYDLLPALKTTRGQLLDQKLDLFLGHVNDPEKAHARPVEPSAPPDAHIHPSLNAVVEATEDRDSRLGDQVYQQRRNFNY